MRALLDVEAILARRISHTTGIFLEVLTLHCIYSQWLSWSLVSIRKSEHTATSRLLCLLAWVAEKRATGS
jgi:hypothetical protein